MKPTIAVIVATTAIAFTAIAIAGCSSGQSPADITPSVQSESTAASSAAPVAASSASSAAPVAAPVTSSAVRAAATAYFHLYGAGRYAATWPLLSLATRRAIPERVWVRVHDECVSHAGKLAYKVGQVELAGKTAVVSVSSAGAAASALGSEAQAFAYAGGRWAFVPSDLSAYRGHTVAQAVAALKAQGVCTG
jgi:hypothetical protein